MIRPYASKMHQVGIGLAYFPKRAIGLHLGRWFVGVAWTSAQKTGKNGAAGAMLAKPTAPAHTVAGQAAS